MSYKILRFHKTDETKEIKKGLSLEEAQEWCSDEKTHKKDSNGNVIWFDGYTEE